MKKEKQNNGFLRMLSLETDFEIPNKRMISISKFITRIFKKARTNAKSATCHICGKECSSFCNSHSVPYFVLQNIADHGKVYIPLQGELPTTGKDTGLKQAGTFHLICNDCDNSIFCEYEDPSAYSNHPSDKMLAQISLKNYLQMIYKRKIEPHIYQLLGQRLANFFTLPGQGKTIQELDLDEYQTHFQYAMRALSGKNAPQYYLCFYSLLDYVVPCATQTTIPLLADLEDNIINNLYNFSEEYNLEYLHIAVFPLKETSVIVPSSVWAVLAFGEVIDIEGVLSTNHQIVDVLANDILCDFIHSVNLQFIRQPTTEKMEGLFIAAHGFFTQLGTTAIKHKFIGKPLEIQIFHAKNTPVHWGKIHPIKQEYSLVQRKKFIG